MKTRISLIGVGNILLQDEGVGVQAVEALRKRFDFPEDVRLIDGGTLGLDLLPFIEGMERILFMDAVDLQKEPGTIAIIEDEDLPSFLEPKLSLHHVGLSDLLFTSGLMGIRPPKIILVGIQPEKVEVGLDLSPRVSENFERFLNTILEKLREWGVMFRERTNRESLHVSGHSV
jgi:hydrogenase maturation protease